MDEEGNADFAEQTILIQDPQNICPDKKPLGKITGLLKTEKMKPLKSFCKLISVWIQIERND